MILKQGAIYEYEEKKSVFIGQCFPVKTEEEAFSCIASVKKTHRDARHNCYAFIIGEQENVVRASDDGEPSQTAGKPMLDLLKAMEVTDCLIVVTRYFGGTLLGTGGLVRAYTKAAKGCLSEGSFARVRKAVRLEVETVYANVTPIQNASMARGALLEDTLYTDKVCFRIAVLMEEEAGLKEDIVRITNGSAVITTLGETTFEFPVELSDL